MGDDVRLRDREYSRRELARLAGDLAAVGGVRAVTLDDGSERGLRCLEFRTGGGLRFEVLVDRAMDIGVAEFDDCTVGWRSPTGFRNPALHDHADEAGLSWLRSMSGLIVTAGLDHTLFGGEFDAAHFNYPSKATVRHSLHGRIANIPARLTGYGEHWRDEYSCVLWSEGEVRQAAIFGEHLRLRRRIEADLGGTTIRLTDTVTNAGFDRTPHMFLYHINAGWPLIDVDTIFDARINSTQWQSDSVADQGVSHLKMPQPQPDFVEQVVELDLHPDPDGRTRARLTNNRLSRFFELNYDPSAFPAFFQWLNLREGSYAVALEPSTHHVGGEGPARHDGTMIWLDHGETRQYHTEFHFGRISRPVGVPHQSKTLDAPLQPASPGVTPRVGQNGPRTASSLDILQ